MIDTGMYLPLRMFFSEGQFDEYSPGREDCKGMAHNEYFWCPSGYLLPFQSTYFVTGEVYALNLCDDTSTLLEVVATQVTSSSGRPLYTYLGGAVAGLPDGVYSIRIPEYGYSDPFIVGDTSDMIHLKYRNPIIKSLEDITSWDAESVYWLEGLWGECYINSIIEKPLYPILEEVREDENLNQHRVFQRWDKRHQIRFFGVESMADAMSLLPIMDEVYINSQRVYNTTVNVNWEEDRECLAEIIITFSTKEIVKTF